MTSRRAPKQWPLTKQETINSFEAWRQNIQYTLSIDPNFATFLLEDTTWLRKTNASPLRGLANDDEDVPQARPQATINVGPNSKFSFRYLAFSISTIYAWNLDERPREDLSLQKKHFCLSVKLLNLRVNHSIFK